MAEFMKQNISANKIYTTLIFVVMAIILYRIGASLDLRTYMDDDVYFVKALDNTSLFDFLHMRYMTWSGRFFIEYILVTTINHHMVWRISIPLCLLLLCYSICKTIDNGEKTHPQYFLICLILFHSMPSKTLTEGAWWVTGFYNYLLPVSFGIYAISVVIHYRSQSNFKLFTSILALPVACSNEQMAVTMIALLGTNLIIDKKINAYKTTFLTVTLLSFLILMLAPGNKLRFLGESRRIPEFADYGIIDKIGLGMDRLGVVINASNSLLLISSALLILLYFKKVRFHPDVFGTIVCTIILVFQIAKMNNLLPVQFMKPGDWINFSFYLRYTVALIFYVCIIYIICRVFNTVNDYVTVFTVIFAPATVIMIGFSPTVYASADRVLFLFECMILLVAMACVKKVLPKKPMTKA
ncbi:DUF6056 family protein [Erwinia oleae]|uniref:DUF6056 family protein n=1 Tax=Erwinia oleae TaxID=796334 RepID=UPI002E144A48